MYQLFESIKLLDGIPQNLDYHYRRMEEGLHNYFGERPHYELDIIQLCQKLSLQGCHKLRISYDALHYTHQVEEYKLKKVIKFKLIEDPEISYAFKYEQREAIERWQRELDKDEDLIILQNGIVTDSAYANLLFKSPEQNLFTPENCLLKGTQRQKLLDEKSIKALPISLDDLDRFTHVCRINAMMDLGEDDWLPVDRISFL